VTAIGFFLMAFAYFAESATGYQRWQPWQPKDGWVVFPGLLGLLLIAAGIFTWLWKNLP
jgi:hypothetical protein